MKRTFILPLACAALALAGCGGDDKADTQSSAPPPTTESTPTATEPSSGGGASTVKLSADAGGELKFDKESLTAKAGDVTLEMANPSDLPHAVSVRGDGLDEDGNTVQKGGTSKVTVTLKAGEYEFYCPVGGHEQGGMKGTLTVE